MSLSIYISLLKYYLKLIGCDIVCALSGFHTYPKQQPNPLELNQDVI